MGEKVIIGNKDDGAKVERIDIETGDREVSTDGGKTWTKIDDKQTRWK